MSWIGGLKDGEKAIGRGILTAMERRLVPPRLKEVGYFASARLGWVASQRNPYRRIMRVAQMAFETLAVTDRTTMTVKELPIKIGPIPARPPAVRHAHRASITRC